MSTNFFPNALDTETQIGGTEVFNDATPLSATDESLGGQEQGAADGAVLTANPNRFTSVTGAFTADSIGKYIRITGSGAGNDGAFPIITINGATSVEVLGSPPFTTEAGIAWTLNRPANLKDELNNIRSQERNILGLANWHDPIPTYVDPSAIGTPKIAHLSNIAGNTLDAKTEVVNVLFPAQAVVATNTFITLTTAIGYADAVDRRGLPIFDGADAGDFDSTFVELNNPANNTGLFVIAGPNLGERIYGRLRQGGASEGVDVELEFRSGANDGTAADHAYTWEATQATSIDAFVPQRKLQSEVDENDRRRTLIAGIVGDADVAQALANLQEGTGLGVGVTTPPLTNTVAEFPFGNIPVPGDTSLTEAVNVLNAQIGDRTYTGTILTTGQTIVASLQALANALAAGSILKVVERLSAEITKDTAHTLPGGNTYTPDGTFNAQNMDVFVSGQMQLPDSAAATPDGQYEETSGTQVTFHYKINANQSIIYNIRQ